MEMRGRNGKWFGAGNGRTVRIDWVDVVRELCPRICSWWRGMNAFIVIDVVEGGAHMSQHEHVRGENRGRNGRGLVDGKEGADCGKLTADFFFLNVEEASDVLDHLFMGECQFVAGGTIRRRRGYDVGGVASAVNGGRRAGWNEDGGR